MKKLLQYKFRKMSWKAFEGIRNELNRKITKKEYHIIEKYMYDLGLENGYFQRLGKNEEKYVPNF